MGNSMTDSAELKQLKKLLEGVKAIRSAHPGGDGCFPTDRIDQIVALTLMRAEEDLSTLWLLWDGFFDPEVLEKYDGETFNLEDLKDVMVTIISAKAGMRSPPIDDSDGGNAD
jgi:hypothetical protein